MLKHAETYTTDSGTKIRCCLTCLHCNIRRGVANTCTLATPVIIDNAGAVMCNDYEQRATRRKLTDAEKTARRWL